MTGEAWPSSSSSFIFALASQLRILLSYGYVPCPSSCSGSTQDCPQDVRAFSCCSGDPSIPPNAPAPAMVGVDDPDPVASQLRGVFEQDMADSAVCTGRSCCPVGWARGLLGRPCHSSSHGSSHGSIWPDDPHDPFGFRLRVAFDDQAMADAAFCVADSACG